jgi:hypothetical protein
MRKLMLLFFVGFWQLACAGEGKEKPHELNQWNPLKAEYKIHSKGTAYSEPPTKDDSAFSVAFEGETAKQVFDQMGPDVKPVCDDAQGYRERRNKGAFCTYRPRLINPKDSHYECWIGINLRTGAGSVRASC